MCNNMLGLTMVYLYTYGRGGREIETWPPETISLCLCAPCYYFLITVGSYPCHYTAVTLTTRVIYFYKRFPI